MGFKPIEEVLGDSTLRLPGRGGREWVINPPDALTWQALNMRLAAGIAIKAGVQLDEDDLAYANEQIHVADDQEPDFARQCLNGPNAQGERTRVYEDMLEAGLTLPEVMLYVKTAFLAWTAGRETAELFWNSEGKALAQSPSQPGLRPTETPTPMAAANGTPTTASASGTSTRRKQRARANKAARSRGSSHTTTT